MNSKLYLNLLTGSVEHLAVSYVRKWHLEMDFTYMATTQFHINAESTVWTGFGVVEEADDYRSIYLTEDLDYSAIHPQYRAIVYRVPIPEKYRKKIITQRTLTKLGKQ